MLYSRGITYQWYLIDVNSKVTSKNTRARTSRTFVRVCLLRSFFFALYRLSVHITSWLLWQLGFWTAVDLAGRILFACIRIEPSRTRTAKIIRWTVRKCIRMKNRQRAMKYSAMLVLMYGAFSLFTFKELVEAMKLNKGRKDGTRK